MPNRFLETSIFPCNTSTSPLQHQEIILEKKILLRLTLASSSTTYPSPRLITACPHLGPKGYGNRLHISSHWRARICTKLSTSNTPGGPSSTTPRRQKRGIETFDRDQDPSPPAQRGSRLHFSTALVEEARENLALPSSSSIALQHTSIVLSSLTHSPSPTHPQPTLPCFANPTLFVLALQPSSPTSNPATATAT